MIGKEKKWATFGHRLGATPPPPPEPKRTKGPRYVTITLSSADIRKQRRKAAALVDHVEKMGRHAAKADGFEVGMIGWVCMGYEADKEERP